MGIVCFHHGWQSIGHRSSRGHHHAHVAALHPRHAQGGKRSPALVQAGVYANIITRQQRQRQRRVARTRAQDDIREVARQLGGYLLSQLHRFIHAARFYLPARHFPYRAGTGRLVLAGRLLAAAQEVIEEALNVHVAALI